MRTGAGSGCLIVLAICVLANAAFGQFSSQQARQRYDKNTKGTSIDDFVKRLASDDPDTRLEAVKSLAGTHDPKATEYIIGAMGDSDVRVEAKAITVLGNLRATEATEMLIQRLFVHTSNDQMKQLVLAALGQIGDSRAAQPIMEFLHRDLDTPTRGTAIFALGEIGAPEAIEPLSQIAKSDPDETLRRLASEAITKVEQHQAIIKREVKGPSQTFLEPKGTPGRQ